MDEKQQNHIQQQLQDTGGPVGEFEAAHQSILIVKCIHVSQHEHSLSDVSNADDAPNHKILNTIMYTINTNEEVSKIGRTIWNDMNRRNNSELFRIFDKNDLNNLNHPIKSMNDKNSPDLNDVVARLDSLRFDRTSGQW